jgi:hypothetical protein
LDRLVEVGSVDGGAAFEIVEGAMIEGAMSAELDVRSAA